jgi:hypothetical protein
LPIRRIDARLDDDRFVEVIAVSILGVFGRAHEPVRQLAEFSAAEGRRHDFRGVGQIRISSPQRQLSPIRPVESAASYRLSPQVVLERMEPPSESAEPTYPKRAA